MERLHRLERLHVENPAYFITFCTYRRIAILANPQIHSAFVKFCAEALQKDIFVGRYILMPDHVHLFCSPATVPPEPLERWISYWKAEAARHWPRGAEHPLWQRDFWDTQLRHADSYNAKWSYVRLNPVRKGLVDCEAAWPFQGEENVLRWRE